MNKQDKKKILGITAHADDHIMFAGTVMKLREQGYEYHELILTDSEEGGSYTLESLQTKTEIAKVRSAEFQKASKVLGTEEIFSLHQEDQNLTYSKELMHEVIRIIRRVKPDIGFAMNQIDVHPDHIASGKLAKEAFRWAAKKFRAELGEAYRTPVVLFAEGTIPANVSILVDITKYFAKKEKLFRIYDSQASSKDLALMKSFATLRGYHLRTPHGTYAEAFSVEQNILPILF